MVKIRKSRSLGKAGEKALNRQARQILKGKTFLCSYSEAENNRITAVFKGNKGHIFRTMVFVAPDGAKEAVCEQCGTTREDPLCPHAAAAVMHLDEYPLKYAAPKKADAPARYSGLKYESLPELLAKAVNPPQAFLVVNVESSFPHVPSKWEKTLIDVKIKFGSKNYIGNLSNLRQLHFKKSMAVSLKSSFFSQQEQQIIRFLAINAEPDASKLALDAEQTAEFFHCLTEYPRFFKEGEKIAVHRESAEPVLVCGKPSAAGSLLYPAVAVKNAVMPVKSEKVITGRAGCWLGINGEYWWIPAMVDVAWLRSFFRAGELLAERKSVEILLSGKVPLPVRIIEGNAVKPRTKRCAPVYTAAFEEKLLVIELSFIYNGREYYSDGSRVESTGGKLWKRDSRYEKFVTDELKRFGFRKELASDKLSKFILADIEAAGLFLDKIVPEWIIKGRKFYFSEKMSESSTGGRGVPEINVSCELEKEHSSGYDIKCVFYRDGNSFTWKELHSQLKNNRTYLLSADYRIFKIPEPVGEFIEKASNLVHFHKSKEDIISIPKAAASYWAEAAAGIPGAVPAEFIEVNSFLRSSGKTSLEQKYAGEVSRKHKFKGSLRGYQKEGVAWMKELAEKGFNMILADEMGLGKTIQALAVISMNGEKHPSLILCPSSLTENWKREASTFVPSMKTLVIAGPDRRKLWADVENYSMIITSYALARRDVDIIKEHSFNYIILDEAQNIKNPFTANAMACKQVKARHRMVLTGTPLENSPEDLWSIFDFLHPGLLGTYNNFKSEYGNIHGNREMQDDLATRISPFVMRRKKKDVYKELPPKLEQTLYCGMSPGQKEIYNHFLDISRGKFRNMLKNPGKSSNFEVLSSLLRLRQICCHPALLPPECASSEISSAKTELMKELVYQNIDEGHKILLFSQFTSLLKIVREWMDESKIKYEYLDGSTKDRMRRVDNFNNSKNIPVFLLSLKAGGTGLNLTAADTVIIYDPWWNPAVEAQATDRSHRIGQTVPVNSMKLVVEDSIEERILSLQERKKDIFNNLVDNPEATVKKLDTEALSYILE